MGRHMALIAGMLLVGLGASTSATAQELTPQGIPATATCISPSPVANASPSGQNTPAAEATEAGLGVEPGDEAPLEPKTPLAGTPADAALLERIRAAEENLAGCFNAGNYLAFIALFTPEALLSELGIRNPGDAPAHDASHVILREEIISVSDAQTHADGRVSADVVFAFEGNRMRARDIFIESDGWLLLDEVIELALEPATLGTPELLDEEAMGALSILGFATGVEPGVINVSTLGATVGLPPGGTVVMVLGVFDYEVCGTGIRCFVPVSVRATWSVTPAGAAQIDPATGLLSIDSSAPAGSRLTVRAEVEGGRHVVQTEVYVFTPQSNPLAGYWLEVAQIPCNGGAEVVPQMPIEELVFAADGTFAVTWTPFESYVDYWGTYTVDFVQGTLDLTVTGGNDIPPDIDGHGRVALDAESGLLLTELWLGTPSRLGSGLPICGHRFIR